MAAKRQTSVGSTDGPSRSEEPWAVLRRRAHSEAIRAAAAEVERVRLELEAQYMAAIAARNDAMISAHGIPREGGLSYHELAEAAGISKGRTIQLVQGKSAYSRRRTTNGTG